jgi:hypothetical protein
VLIGQLPPVDVFVAHNSPAGVHERDQDVHQGFAALTDYIRRHTPRLMIHGHQHFNRETVVGRTRVVGVFGSRVDDGAGRAVSGKTFRQRSSATALPTCRQRRERPEHERCRTWLRE